MSSKEETAVFGGGCFWCLDAAYAQVKGVSKVISGFAGGHWPNPTSDRVYSGTTGHAEVVEVHFDPKIIDYKTLVEIFWTIHDPTTLNRQNYDVGTEYRSIILYKSSEQEKTARDSMNTTAKKLWGEKITTELVPLEKFWPAEDYHQDFYANHPEAAYCQIIINPKLAKLNKKFAQLLKD